MSIDPTPENYVVWTSLPRLSDDIAAFNTSPHDIVINKNGNEISQAAFDALTTKNSDGVVTSGAADKIEAILLTIATNKARKTLGLDSFKELRYKKNTVNRTITNDGGKYKPDGQAKQANIELMSHKRFVFTYPNSHPFALSTSVDGRGSGAKEFTYNVTRDATAKTLTVDVDNNFPDKLYYYCTDHPNMGGVIDMKAPYQKDPDQYMPGNLIFQHGGSANITKLTVDDIKVDVSAIEVGAGKYFENQAAKQAALDSLYYLPTVNAGNGKFNTDLTEFKKQQDKGNIFLDLEDAIDPVGNLIEMDDQTTSPAFADAMAYGRGAMPIGITQEARRNARTGQNWYQKMIDDGEMSEFVFIEPQTVKSIKDDASSLNMYSLQVLKRLQYFHQVVELTDSSKAFAAADNFYFDDLFTILNIKDPAFGIDAITKNGGPDLTHLQRVRACNMIHDDGIVTKYRNAVLAPCDQPRGAIFLGDYIIAPPNEYIPAKYDGAIRLDIFNYGAQNQLIKKPSTGPNKPGRNWNVCLRNRIKNDFKRGGLDLSETALDNLTLSWGAAQSLPSTISEDHFKLRKADKKNTTAALENDGGDIDGLPQVKVVTIGLSGQTFKYAVFNDDVKYKYADVEQPKGKLMNLDEYGYDLNFMDTNTQTAQSNTYLIK